MDRRTSGFPSIRRSEELNRYDREPVVSAAESCGLTSVVRCCASFSSRDEAGDELFGLETQLGHQLVLIVIVVLQEGRELGRRRADHVHTGGVDDAHHLRRTIVRSRSGWAVRMRSNE